MVIISTTTTTTKKQVLSSDFIHLFSKKKNKNIRKTKQQTEKS